jgi:hypothetical protein
MQTAGDYRVMWDTVERLWSDAIAGHRAQPDDQPGDVRADRGR